MTKESDTGAVHFELLSSTPAPPALSDNVFVMAVTSEAGERKSGALSVALDMPQHGHSSPKQPEIAFDPATEAFTLEPLRLFMVGLWRLTFTFEADAEKPPSNAPKPESAVFRFCVQ